MSRAVQNFEYGIKDAEELLAHFDALNGNPPPGNAEVLKRAGLVMALTAWETYVEDRLVEAMEKKLGAVEGSYVGDFVSRKLTQDLKQFHNPNSEKTKRIFQEYLGVDVTMGWSWQNHDPEKARTTLNAWIGKRGDAVHRSRPANIGAPVAHLIKRDELEKVIRFVKDLVKATDAFVEKNTWRLSSKRRAFLIAPFQIVGALDDYTVKAFRLFPASSHALTHNGCRPRPVHASVEFSGLRYLTATEAALTRFGTFVFRISSTDRPALWAMCRICSRALLIARKWRVLSAS